MKLSLLQSAGVLDVYADERYSKDIQKLLSLCYPALHSDVVIGVHGVHGVAAMDWDKAFLPERGYPAWHRHPVIEEGGEVSRERGKERER